MRVKHVLVATVAALAAAGCSQEAEAPANQQQPAEANAMMADPSNPYVQAEMQMMERMEGARGSNPSETWALKMIEHHRGAIAMSEILLAQGGEPQVLEKARMTADMQRKEIDELMNLVRANSGAGTASVQGNPFAEVVSEMHQQMMTAQGDNPSELWLSKMIAHHRGGAAMSNVLLRLGGNPQVLEKARMTAQKQEQEAAELERMLRGEASPPAAEATGEPAPSTSEARPKAPVKAKTEAPKAEPKAAEPEPVDPHAGHDMNNM